jgi:hypothetical protein
MKADETDPEHTAYRKPSYLGWSGTTRIERMPLDEKTGTPGIAVGAQILAYSEPSQIQRAAGGPICFHQSKHHSGLLSDEEVIKALRS